MILEQKTESEIFFSEQIIYEQIQKIFTHHPFTVSQVLRSFLSYIVNETISGREKDIKEYNIAVDVLKRPAHFKTGHSGVVRVHARRLRKALDSYYQEKGITDECIISVPTGRYVPVFKNSESAKPLFPELKSIHYFNTREKIKIGVLPFGSFEQEVPRTAFVDSIGVLLSDGLGALPGVSVFSYFALQKVKKNDEDIQTLVAGYGVEYLLGGHVQFEGSAIRICFQLIQAATATQLYSDMIYLTFDSNHFFDLGDLVASRILTVLGEFSGWSGQQLIRNSSDDLLGNKVKSNKFLIRENKMRRTATA